MKEMLLLGLLGFAISAVFIRFILASGMARRLALDAPNDRSLHQGSIPRSGGVGVMLSIAICSFLATNPMSLLVSLTILLAFVSLLDDRYRLPIIVRLVIHIASAAIVILVMMPGLTGFMLAMLVLLLVWGINLYNFMDGANGLAGGMTTIGFSFLGIATLSGNWIELSVLCFSIAMAALGFLIFNFGQAKIFLGDNGSIPLGFLAGSICVLGCHRSIWPATFPLLVFLPFLADATVTLLKRLLRGDTFWQPHREHYYQRLIRMGWSHRKTALAYYCWMVMAGLSGLGFSNMSIKFQLAVLSAWFVLIFLAFRQVDARWRQRNIN